MEERADLERARIERILRRPEKGTGEAKEAKIIKFVVSVTVLYHIQFLKLTESE